MNLVPWSSAQAQTPAPSGISGRGTRALTPIPAAPGQPTPGPSATAPSQPPPQSTPPVQPAATPGAPPQRPYLRVSAPFHTQVVNAVAQDPAGRLAATVSDDKTIRIWRADTGEALATLRVPIGDGDEGELYAVAISPDGKTLLAGGQTGATWDAAFCIYLFDLEGQRLKGRLPNLPASINHIAYAPSGNAFAVALGGGQGVRLFDANTGRMIASDDEGFRERVTWISFDRTGRFAAVTLDGEVRLYDPAGKRIARRTPFAGRPYSAAFNAGGSTLAVGYSDQPRIELLSSRDLSPQGNLVGARNEAGGLGAVAFGRNDRLFAAGSLRNATGEVVVRSWTGPRSPPVDWPAARDTVFQLDPTPDGGVLVASADPALARLGPNGALAFRDSSPGLDFRDIAERRFTLSRDGYAVTLQARGMSEPLTIDMLARRIDPPSGTRAIVPVAAAPPIRVTNWRNNPAPQVEGRVLKLAPQELSRSFALAPGTDLVVIGTDYQLRVFHRDGTRAGDGVPLPAAAWGLAVSGDGKVLVAAVGDGTLRWFGLDQDGTLTPRLAVFPLADGTRWVAWTPDGRFDHADRGGKELVGLQINRAKGQAPEWFTFAQVYRLMYGPDAVTASLRGDARPGGTDSASLVNELRTALGNKPPAEVSVVAVCWPRPGGEQCSDVAPTAVARGLRERTGDDGEVHLPVGIGATTIRYRVVGEPNASVDVFLNGRSVMRSVTTRGGGDAQLPPVPLDPGANQIQLRAYGSDRQTYAQSRVVSVARAAEPAPVVASNTPSGSTQSAQASSSQSAPRPTAQPAGAQAPDPARPRAYVLVAGVDKYRRGINELNFAVADARTVGEAIKANAPKEYSSVSLVELFDQDSSLDRLKAELKKIATVSRPEDTVLIYLSGHGITIDNKYYFVTQNVTSVETIPQQAFSESDLIDAMAAIRARNGLVFLDTCHAGAFSLDSASQISHESGRYVLAASASLEEALDSFDNRNGVFATAVLRGLKGGAAQGRTVVDNFGLGFYVRDLVKELAAEKHHAQSARFKIATEDARPFPIVDVAKP